MVAAVFATTYALILFGLASEAQTDWLRIVGFIAATWMAIAGAMAGYQRFRD